MKIRNRAKTWMRLVLVPVAILLAGPGQAQEARDPAIHITTLERLQTETWWPTMTTASLQAYAGSESCTRCHGDRHAASATGMQRAATRGPEARFLPNSAPYTFASGALTYSLSSDKTGLQLSASSGLRRFTHEADWVFGAGDLARTFLYRTDGRWLQSEVSFYTQPSALDITTGFGPSTGASPMAAMGNVLSPAEARACFGCHTVHAVTSAGLEPLHAEAGIGCEACHGPGVRHVDLMTQRQSKDSVNPKDVAIFQPAKLSPSDSIDFCGSCHRSFADASLSTGPQADRAVVRFQPYRLEESKCWRTTQDERLTCVACHNPHKPLNRDSASYDSNCLRCHSSGTVHAEAAVTAAVCPKATRGCVTCHMPKVQVPSMHGSFTDHFIRIAREGEPLPR